MQKSMLSYLLRVQVPGADARMQGRLVEEFRITLVEREPPGRATAALSIEVEKLHTDARGDSSWRSGLPPGDSRAGGASLVHWALLCYFQRGGKPAIAGEERKIGMIGYDEDDEMWRFIEVAV